MSLILGVQVVIERLCVWFGIVNGERRIYRLVLSRFLADCGRSLSRPENRT